jgi:membrane protein implicated in regulation of membrane protease activity
MTELLQWWYLIFVLPFVGALFYILMLISGTVSADHDTDLDAGVETDADIGHDADLGHDGGLEHVHDLEPGMLARALSFLGIGRVPLSIIIISFCFLWGFFGFASNTLLAPLLPPFIFIWASIAIALVVSLSLTRILANAMARIMPATETYAVSLEQLVGKWGEATTSIDETFGQAQVHDDAGVLHMVQCVVKSGETKIPGGSQVILLFFDKTRGVFFVGTEMPAIKSD